MALLDITKIWLSPFAITSALLTGLAFFVAYRYIYNTYFHPLSKFPGPFWGRMTRLWLAYHNIRSTEVEAEYKLHKKYGTTR
jgi:hypothetical protein